MADLDPRFIGAGDRLGDPVGDPAREAVASLRGYAYQLYASALAWLRLSNDETLYLEVADDFATTAGDALDGVQAKDTAGSGSLTINSPDVAASVDSFVDLVIRNVGRRVTLRHLTTSPIGRERAADDRIDDGPALQYWRRAAAGAALTPLRAALLRLKLKDDTRQFIEERDDDALRSDLVRRIYWDAGQAPVEELSEELVAGLVELCAGPLHLGADAGRKLADAVLVAVLRTAIKPTGRRLRRADLITLADEVGRMPISRELIESILGKAHEAASSTRQTLLAVGERTASNEPTAERRILVGDVLQRLSDDAFIALTGSTGMGKTDLAWRAASGRQGDWHVADFRNVLPQAASSRLTAILGEIAVLPIATIVLDDLDCMDDPAVRRAAAKLVAAMRRRDGVVLVTCASSPTRRTMDAICGSSTATIDVPYLTIEEVGDLVEQAGGPAKVGRLVHLAGSAGHPQLVQAVILHMRDAGWSRGAIRDLLGSELPDVTEERRVARDRLVDAMPAGARSLLFRTSLILGRFSRTLALELADVDPTVTQPGIEFDRLVGPWIERIEKDQLRVSPLVSQAGRDTLSPAESTRVHQTIASHLLRKQSISVSDGDAILHHALAGGDRSHVQAYAHSVITCSNEMLGMLARHAPMVTLLSVEEPLFSYSPS